MREKKQLAIVCGVTSNWLFAVGTLLISIKRKFVDSEYDVIIFCDTFTKQNCDVLNKIHSCIFVKYDLDKIDSEDFKRVSKMAFSRFECFELLNDYKKVLWLDADTIVVGKLNSLLNKSGSGIAMYLHSGVPASVSFKKTLPGYDLTRECFNDGVMLLDDSITNPSYITEWCYKMTNELSSFVASDQAIINIALQEFDLKPKQLTEDYNCHPWNETLSTCIVHTWPTKKFWKGQYHPKWIKYYREWKSLGGESIEDELKNIPKRRLLKVLIFNLKLVFKTFKKLMKI